MSGMEPLLLLGGGAGLAAYGQIQQGKAERNAANFNATMIERQSAQKEQLQRTQSQRQIGAIRAGISKSGVRTEGTPLMVLAESAANAEIDALNTRYGGEMEAGLSRSRGANASRAAKIGAATSLLQSAQKAFQG